MSTKEAAVDRLIEELFTLRDEIQARMVRRKAIRSELHVLGLDEDEIEDREDDLLRARKTR